MLRYKEIVEQQDQEQSSEIAKKENSDCDCVKKGLPTTPADQGPPYQLQVKGISEEEKVHTQDTIVESTGEIPAIASVTQASPAPPIPKPSVPNPIAPTAPLRPRIPGLGIGVGTGLILLQDLLFPRPANLGEDEFLEQLEGKKQKYKCIARCPTQQIDPQVQCREIIIGIGCGNIQAQKFIAYMYDFGQGVESNPSEAIRWYRLPAQAGDPFAQSNLALLLWEKEPEETIRFYTLAAQQGFPFTQETLGDIYSGHLSLSKNKYRDDILAIEWYEKAAKKGFPMAAHRLGEMYSVGQGVSQNLEKAIFWYKKAAEQGDESSEKGAKIVIILDNASFHKKEEYIEKIEKEMPNIHLEYLP